MSHFFQLVLRHRSGIWKVAFNYVSWHDGDTEQSYRGRYQSRFITLRKYASHVAFRIKMMAETQFDRLCRSAHFGASSARVLPIDTENQCTCYVVRFDGLRIEQNKCRFDLGNDIFWVAVAELQIKNYMQPHAVLTRKVNCVQHLSSKSQEPC